jgi:hypothetical protein
MAKASRQLEESSAFVELVLGFRLGDVLFTGCGMRSQ